MRRVGPGEEADHLTTNLLARVGELWADMEAVGRKPDYLTYNELIRAHGSRLRVGLGPLSARAPPLHLAGPPSGSGLSS